ncbi:MAG: PAS domain-containing protein [Flavobacteriales bacterium]|nr:PAS domain-containing protein [Flavobacteriales bacterium]
MNYLGKSKEELIKELKKSQQKYDSLKEILKKDSTERKEIEGKSEIITQSILDIIFILDKKGKINFMNNSVEKTLGYLPKDVIGKSFTNEQLFIRFLQMHNGLYLV